MAKVHKMLSLDIDVSDRLSKMKPNASIFVNDLLKRKFEMESLGHCEHEWCIPFSTPGGLMKECRLCRKTEFVEVSKD